MMASISTLFILLSTLSYIVTAQQTCSTTITYKLRSSTPHIACHVEGATFTKPSVLSGPQPVESEQACIALCMGAGQCKALAFDSSSLSCTTYTKKPINMGLRRSGGGEGYTSNRRCYVPVPAPVASLVTNPSMDNYAAGWNTTGSTSGGAYPQASQIMVYPSQTVYNQDYSFFQEGITLCSGQSYVLSYDTNLYYSTITITTSLIDEASGATVWSAQKKDLQDDGYPDDDYETVTAGPFTAPETDRTSVPTYRLQFAGTLTTAFGGNCPFDNVLLSPAE